jgi:hypothetical protein
LRSLDHPLGEARGLHRSDYVELLTQASHDAFATLKVRKAIFGGLKLFAGVGGRAIVSFKLRLCGCDQVLLTVWGYRIWKRNSAKQAHTTRAAPSR